jgi:adenylate kinase
MRLLIVGPPGAGKGTQATLLAVHYGIPTISTGDIFRANIASGTPLGKQVKEILDAGGYVADETTNVMVRGRLAEDDVVGGFLLDGYPRTRAQVAALDAMLDETGVALDAVAELVVDREEVVGRLVQRAQTDGRTDDSEEVIRKRQDIYRQETAPLLETYQRRGLVVQVDGLGEIQEVADRLVKAVDRALAGRPRP